jgi:hypothetical protein
VVAWAVGLLTFCWSWKALSRMNKACEQLEKKIWHWRRDMPRKRQGPTPDDLANGSAPYPPLSKSPVFVTRQRIRSRLLTGASGTKEFKQGQKNVTGFSRSDDHDETVHTTTPRRRPDDPTAFNTNHTLSLSQTPQILPLRCRSLEWAARSSRRPSRLPPSRPR